MDDGLNVFAFTTSSKVSESVLALILAEKEMSLGEMAS